MSGPLEEAKRLIAAADRVVGFTGAGLSTASGIPDFRGPDGLWSRIDPEELSYERFLADPARFWRWRAELRQALNLDAARPNAAHNAMAAAVNDGRLTGIITQNIDGLHQVAGAPASHVIELHGSGREASCIECDARAPMAQAAAQLDAGHDVPLCPACQGILKPAVVLFGEMLPLDALCRAEELAAAADVMLVAGSSLVVRPAAGLPTLTVKHGGALIIINREPTGSDAQASFVLRQPVESAVPWLLGTGRPG